MANLYGVQTSSGKNFDVTTNKHHDDHDDKTFRDHLLDVIKGTASQVIGEVVVRYTFKGRK